MAFTPLRVFSATLSAAVGSFSVSTSEPWARVNMVIPTMASATAFDVYASPDSGTTYYQVRHAPPASSSVQAASYIVSAAANGAIIPLPAGLVNYRLIATDSAPTAALTFKLMCSD